MKQVKISVRYAHSKGREYLTLYSYLFFRLIITQGAIK